MPVFAFDVSNYQYNGGSKILFNPANLKAMKDNGFLLAIMKFSMGGGADPSVDYFVNLFRDNGFKIGGYHWADPTQNLDFQGGIFSSLITKYKPDCTFFDQEQYWAIWTQYEAWRNGTTWFDPVQKKNVKVTQGSIIQIPWDKIVLAGNYLIDLIQPITNGLSIPLETYTGKWFVDWPKVNNPWPWIKTKFPWLAEYPFIPPVNRVCKTWADFNNLYNIYWKNKYPVLPNGITKECMWQVSGTIQLPGISEPIDINVFNGEIDSFNQFLNKKPPRKYDELLDSEKLSLLKHLYEDHGYLDRLENVDETKL